MACLFIPNDRLRLQLMRLPVNASNQLMVLTEHDLGNRLRSFLGS
jgi:hypothetical protein